MIDLTAARAAARAAIEKLYDSTCVITGYTGVDDETTKETVLTASTLYSGACHLSQASPVTAEQSTSADQLDYDAVLFLPPCALVTAGCDISVTQNSITTSFEQAGEPAVYTTHKEVKVKRVSEA